jgi:Holliday junction resolvasome RuvABC endonuclease subunit
VILIALDLGLTTGWCLHDTHEAWWHSGTWNLKGSRYDSSGMRFVRFRAHLKELIANANYPDLVAYEEVRRHLGVDASHAYGGFLAVLQEECEQRGVPYMGVPVGTVKKTATGRGNASKEDMMAAARARWLGWEPVDDNEADARWVAVAAAGEVKGE